MHEDIDSMCSCPVGDADFPPLENSLLFVAPVYTHFAASCAQVRNFSDLSSLAGLSLGTMLLALIGNAACIPRALYTRDPAWTFGSTWGCLLMGWAQLLSLYLGLNPETG